MANIVTIVINPIVEDVRNGTSLADDAEGELREALAKYGTITSVTSS